MTPILTFSADAHRFFIQRPHSFLGHLRSLELSFTNPNDHLYLTKRGEDEAAAADDEHHAVGGASTGDDDNSALMNMLARPAPPAPGGGCGLETYPPSSIRFGEKLWGDLLRGMRAASPNLRDLSVTVAGRISRGTVLSSFGRYESEDQNGEGIEAVPGGEEAPLDVWELPGKLAVTFKPGGETYVQEGGKMARQDMEQA